MRETKQWTLMFYMASDNPLAISIVTQLKAIKDAGFHNQVNVIAQFDPFTEGTPTHIFDVNLANKLRHPCSSNIGFEGNSFVWNLIEDKLWRDEKRESGKLVRESLEEVIKENLNRDYSLPRAPDLNGHSQPTTGRRRHEPDPYASLRTFLNFCSQRYPARRYMLFMLGHGVVVGNDVFMFDEHAENKSITLSQMGQALTDFKDNIKEQGATFELVSFHSCSVSSLEVAYELKDTANYMLASQAPAFVGSWPYRQILIRIFNDLERNGNRTDIKELLHDIFYYCFHNCTDYLLAGYSHQVTLCDLTKVGQLKELMAELSDALVDALVPGGVGDAASKFVILYAHWRAQSFYQEMYTDLYDFCHCIVDRCERIEESKGASATALTEPLARIKKACLELMPKLAKPEVPTVSSNGNDSQIAPVVVKSGFTGPAYQYSHGLSVYFPWSQPSDDSQIMEEYKTYKFHSDFHAESNTQPQSSWLDFLEEYFEDTRRFTKRDELKEQSTRRKTLKEMEDRRLGKSQDEQNLSLEQKIDADVKAALEAEANEKKEAFQEEIASLVYNGEGPLGGVALKDYPSEKTGEDCSCLSIKNYPRDTRARGQRRKKAQRMPVSDTLLGQF